MHVTMFLFIFEIHFGNPHSVFKLIGEIMKWILKYLSLGWFFTCLSLSPTFFFFGFSSFSGGVWSEHI